MVAIPGCSFYVLLIAAAFTLLLLRAEAKKEECDYFEGSWVEDEAYPLYNSSLCPFIEREFNCLGNARPDRSYLRYRWQPRACTLTRFDGKDFLQKFKGKSIMFVGDSLSRNQWQSLTCLLYTSTSPVTTYNQTRIGDVSTFTFTGREGENLETGLNARWEAVVWNRYAHLQHMALVEPQRNHSTVGLHQNRRPILQRHGSHGCFREGTHYMG
ncbi:unnamed protein product [Cuscuta epithymum]|uniref:Trichome birefringence-like N-terminal domain-containing protein n=1 Tax=Cuscuta epithymum TaxID=186058 RepID=A0AAV0G6K4_9ASTE|nr:unnamed protein product [Cuscuta epithymum]